eukprot:760264-Hanusia_phi.AAC.1
MNSSLLSGCRSRSRSRSRRDIRSAEEGHQERCRGARESTPRRSLPGMLLTRCEIIFPDLLSGGGGRGVSSPNRWAGSNTHSFMLF